MSGLAKRRERIARIRGLEYRAACAKVTAAQMEQATLIRISRRIASIQDEMVEAQSGQALRARAEMKMRLAAAQESLRTPLRDAQRRVECHEQERHSASQRREKSIELQARAVRAEEAAAALRADANRPFRKRTAVLGVIS